MIERYTRPAMGAIWNDHAKVQNWLAIELAVCEAWTRRGTIPEADMAAIRKASIDLGRMLEIEKETDHDLIAFLRAVGETVGESARFIHLGMTSSDVVDTGLAMQAKQAGDLLLAGLERLTDIVRAKAIEHKWTLTIGRSHGMHAEPTTFGLKLSVWYDELRRHQARLKDAIETIAVGQISGAVGTHAHVPWGLEEEVCAELGLGVELSSTQIIQRDRHACFMSVLAGIGASLEKFAVEIRHLQRSEVAEAEEFFGEGNQGSSAMPHKRNPHESERVSGLARLLRGYATTALENVALWHERDISHNSVERIIFPDATIVLDYMIDLMAELIEHWVIYPERMLANLESSGGLIYSQRVLLALVESGMDRQEAYKLVQKNAHAALAAGERFKDRVSSLPEFTSRLSAEQIDRLFDPMEQLHAVDATFERLGLGVENHQEAVLA
ncbi:MAG: adenylosuccinate lyase [Thermomicrobiales bacterium]